jgi:hypothetical protein
MVFNQLSKEYGLDEVPYIFAETSLRNKAVSDNENNLIRSTLELASAMIGGADAVFTNNYLVDRSTDNSEEISFKQQIVWLTKVSSMYLKMLLTEVTILKILHRLQINHGLYSLK